MEVLDKEPVVKLREYKVAIKGISRPFDSTIIVRAENYSHAWKVAREEVSGIIDDVYPVDGDYS